MNVSAACIYLQPECACLLSLGLYVYIPGTCDCLVLVKIEARNRGLEKTQEKNLEKKMFP